MRTLKAIEEEAWAGMTALKGILGEKRRDLDGSLVPTSVSISEFDAYRRFALLATLVSHHRADLLSVVARELGSDMSGEKALATIAEVNQIGGALRALSKRLDSLADELDSVRAELWTLPDRAREGE